MSDVIHALGTPIGMAVYFLGVGSACAWHCIKHRLGKKREPINWTSLGILVGISCLIFVGMQNTQLAAEVKACQHEFNTAIVDRNTIRETNDRLSREHRYWLSKHAEAVADLIRFTFNPPDPKIAAMEMGTPQRRAYQDGLVAQFNLRTERYRLKITSIEAQQTANLQEWSEHPLPDPECGR